MKPVNAIRHAMKDMALPLIAAGIVAASVCTAEWLAATAKREAVAAHISIVLPILHRSWQDGVS